ncbi:winged helix-turn-helix transcriptional regulator [Nonomuraea sp. KC401]|uniref:ArsR/SmtB family transcription factor n=1 Tax=unclassified Nonomuraea TaxID=2593643 RepID=UPI0010FE9B19|nr:MULTISPECIES: winged helix-turn-helix domain-containing protein [unclassified Nonomuraea]NBE92345.1 helix-turn-helix domain-containing protein [Nonomuraea sp. K271]TLF81852.1 winged helix-turn-helix transcriptional regulator [Nonomuraea sp. KC401]
MISFELGVEDLADTHFALSPLEETVLSLRVLREPGLYALHLPWRRSALARLDARDTRLLTSLVGSKLALPDFLTPRPTTFAPTFEEQLSLVRRTPPKVVRRDVPAALVAEPVPDNAAAARFRDTACDVLRRYWELTIEPMWPQMQLVLEADMTYRARQLAVGGARMLFADMHPNLRWHDGVLSIDQMIGRHHVAVSGRGLLLMPSVFAHKPTPPVHPEEPPRLTYPCRGVATLWHPAPAPDATALVSLLGAPRAALLGLLDEPLPTVELARRLKVTPSAVSQHLRVLYTTGLLTRARDGRHVLYRRSDLGDQLAAPPAPPRTEL